MLRKQGPGPSGRGRSGSILRLVRRPASWYDGPQGAASFGLRGASLSLRVRVFCNGSMLVRRVIAVSPHSRACYCTARRTAVPYRLQLYCVLAYCTNVHTIISIHTRT